MIPAIEHWACLVFVSCSRENTHPSPRQDTGLVLDVGELSVQVLVVVEGQPLDFASRRVHHMGGQIVTCLMEGFAQKSDLAQDVLSEKQRAYVARDIKETLGCCAADQVCACVLLLEFLLKTSIATHRSINLIMFGVFCY